MPEKCFWSLRNTITSNHNLLAAILYSKGTLRHTGIYDIVHEVDRVGAGDAFVGGMIYGLLTYPDNDQKTFGIRPCRICIEKYHIWRFQSSNSRRSGRVNARKHFRKSSQITIFTIIAKQN